MSKFFISKIKTLLKIFKLLLKPYEAQPLTEFNNKDIENIDFSLKRKKNLKKKRKFYIIRRSPGAGLFSNFIYVQKSEIFLTTKISGAFPGTMRKSKILIPNFSFAD